MKKNYGIVWTSLVFLFLLGNVSAAQQFKNVAKMDAIINLGALMGFKVVIDDPVTGNVTKDVTGLSPEQALGELIGPSYMFYFRDGAYHVRKRVASDPVRAMRADPTDIPTTVPAQYYPSAVGQTGRSNVVAGYQPYRLDLPPGWYYEQDRPVNHYGTYRPYQTSYGGGYGGYAYNYCSYGVECARQWRKLQLEGYAGAFKIDSDMPESELQLHKVYVDGCYRDIASKLDDGFNGKVGLKAGTHRIEVVNARTGVGTGEDVMVEPAALTQAFSTQHFNIRLDPQTMEPNYQRQSCGSGS